MLSFYVVLPINSKRRIHLRLSIPLPLLSAFIFHTISLASSSFIEEEHQIWYYLTPTLLLLLLAQSVYNNLKSTWQDVNFAKNFTRELQDSFKNCVLLLSIVLCRRLNQTGNKWRHLKDIADFLIQSDKHLYLTLTFIFGKYIFKFQELHRQLAILKSFHSIRIVYVGWCKSINYFNIFKNYCLKIYTMFFKIFLILILLSSKKRFRGI